MGSKKAEHPDLRKELDAVYRRIDEKIAEYGELSNDEINEIIHEHRQKRKNYLPAYCGD